MHSSARAVEAQYFLLVLILLFAFALRVWDVSARSLWFDEGIEYWVAASPVSTLLSNVQSGIQDPPLYSFLLHLWMSFGQRELHLRFLSVYLGLASVLGVILLGHRSSGRSTGLIGGLVMALLPAEIRYSQEVGQYALMGCLIAWNLVALVAIVQDHSRRAYGLWILSAIAGTYSYYGAALAILVPFGYVMAISALRKKRSALIKACVALFSYGVGILPLVVFFLPKQLFRGPTSQAFQKQLMPLTSEVGHLWESTQRLVSFQITGWPWTNIPDWIPTFLIVSSLVLSVIYSLKHTKNTQFLAWLIATWGVYYLVSRFGLFPYGFRYSLILTPLLVLCIAHGIASGLQEKWMRPISVILLLAIASTCILSLPNRTFGEWAYPHANWIWPETQDLRPVTQFWMEHRKDPEPTYVYYGALPAFRYYLYIYDQVNDRPPTTWHARFWQPESRHTSANEVFYGAWLRHLSPEEKIASIQATLGYDPQRLWLIFSHVYPGEDTIILDGLLENYKIILSFEERGASTYLIEQR